MQFNDSMIDVPFSARNAIWGATLSRPYLPHRDPKNFAFYIPVPNPAKDPNWLAPDLPDLPTLKPHDVIATEATIPSIHSEGITAAGAEDSVQEVTNAGHEVVVAAQAPPLDDSIADEAVAEPQEAKHSSDAASSPAAYSSPASEHVPAEDDLSSLPSPVIATVGPQQRTPVWAHGEGFPMRPATAVETRKLENVMFDSDGHMGFTPQAGATVPLPVRRQKAESVRVKNVDESSSQTSPVNVEPQDGGVLAQWLLKKCPRCSMYGDFRKMPCDTCRAGGRVSRSLTVQEVIERVTEVYEGWGLNGDDAYVDVVTGFHKVGNPGKRLCMGVGPSVGDHVWFELSSWSETHTKVTVFTEAYVIATETCRDDQVVKFVKDCLWFLFNKGQTAPQVTLIDTTHRALVPGKYGGLASVDATTLLQQLTKAWGAKFQLLKPST